MTKKIMAVLLSILMMVSIMPYGISAEETLEEPAETDNSEEVKEETEEYSDLNDGEGSGTYEDLTYEIEDDHIIITGCNKDVVSVTIPRTIGDYPVTKIGWGAFDGCSKMTKVTIPYGITHIDAWAFGNCSSLGSVTIPKSVTEITGWTFGFCTALKSITIPDSVTYLGGNTFYGCTNLIKATLGASVELIGGGCFENCSSLESITIPDSVKEINYRAFYGCISLKNVELGNSVTLIDNIAFSGCTSLQNIKLPASLTDMGNVVFQNCSGLKKVYFMGDCPNFESPQLFDDAMTLDAYYPIGNSSWTADKKQQFGAKKVTWHPWNPITGEIYSTDDFDPTPKAPIIQKGKPFWFYSQYKTASGKMKYLYNYDENWFFGNSTRYNHDFARMSLKMAMASNADDETHLDNSNIITMYKSLQFPEPLLESNYEKPGDNTIGYTIGAKNIIKDGEPITLIAVTIRSGGYGQEWAGNFNIGDGTNHEGFDLAAGKVLTALKNYISNKQEQFPDYFQKKIKIWISGYSRGAATANLLGAKLDDGAIPGIKKEDIFSFAFECPRNTTASNAGSSRYNNLFYIFNPLDFVPKVAMEAWGFTRYGQEKIFKSASTNSPLKYLSIYKPKMMSQYSSILYFNNISNLIETVTLSTYETIGQSDSLDYLMDYIAGLAKNTENYTENHQTRVMNIVRKFLGKAKQNGVLIDALIEIFKLFGDNKIASLLENDYESAIKYAGKDLLSLIQAVYLFEDGVICHQEGHYPAVLRAHYPELCLAWMEAGFADSDLEPTEIIDENSIQESEETEEDEAEPLFGPSTNRLLYTTSNADISIYDEENNLLARIVDGEPEEIEYGLFSYRDYNGQRVFVIPDDCECRVVMKCLEGEQFNYTCVEHNIADGTAEKLVSYTNIDSTSGNEYIGIIENIEENEDAGAYELYKGEERIDPDIVLEDEDIPVYSVSLSVEGDGEAFGGGRFVPGEYAAMHVLEGEENFLGWYDQDDNLLSNEPEYRFLVEKDTHITAKFKITDKIVSFVTRLYSLCFNRKPDQGGLNGWVTKLKNKQITAAQAVTGFFNSKEMQNLQLSNEDFIERCYLVMMDRASDAGGKKNWLEKADSGVSNTYILRGFVASKEFGNICNDFGIERGTITLTEPRDQNLGITQFVSRCYSEVLGRKADKGGLNTWCKKILDASDRKRAAINMASTGFFHSREYLNKNTANDEYVKTLYRTFLGREADTGGYNGWMAKLDSGTSRDTVLMGFANSKEFANIMAKYGIK